MIQLFVVVLLQVIYSCNSFQLQQNERAIRNSIESSKVLKQKDVILGLSVDQSTEKAMWTNTIVKDELTRPLIVKDNELHQIEYDENKIKQRLLKVR